MTLWRSGADWPGARGHFAVFPVCIQALRSATLLGFAYSFPVSPPSRSSALIMDVPEPDQSPFTAVSAHTSKLTRQYQAYLDACTPHTTYRWVGSGVLLFLFFLRIAFAQGWYIVAYTLGIYLLNLFLAFLTPKFDPSLTQDEGLEDGDAGASPSLPTKQDDEFRPFIRRLPEFKFWHAATRAIAIAFVCSWLSIFDIPVFWPVLVVYWIILFVLTMRRQIQHMIKYRYVPFSFGKTRYGRS
ncbi:hypothetical protein PENDEC_c007G00246 [Penicillium decumbens]|uniref:Protein RER1 n=1 Tax=Penicillium decumbens TaxID=69771 RepID=A0A1V6PET7_PENDC|nr:hypothetical protein PENDEC_c007G00246 [Penicillium decumbens]